jgi:hypothetical protein
LNQFLSSVSEIGGRFRIWHLRPVLEETFGSWRFWMTTSPSALQGIPMWFWLDYKTLRVNVTALHSAIEEGEPPSQQRQDLKKVGFYFEELKYVRSRVRWVATLLPMCGVAPISTRFGLER